MSLTMTGAYCEDGTASILTAGQERSLPVRINAGRDLYAVTFSANGEHLLSSGRDQNVQVWRVQDGRRVATIDAKDVLCLAVSNNGKWIAGGTWHGYVSGVWDAETYETVWKRKEDYLDIYAVDFSPDSTKLVSASWNWTATIWDVASGEKIHKLLVSNQTHLDRKPPETKTSGHETNKLQHKQAVVAAKFSSDGNRIATATYQSIHVWDIHGQLLVVIPVTVTPWYNTSLLWFNDQIFVVSGSTIKQLDASTGSTVSAWLVPNSDFHSCIAIPRHGNFITCSTSCFVTLWDTSTHLQISLIEHAENICSIELSPDNMSLAIGGSHGTIITDGLSHFIGLCFEIGDAALDAWKNDQLEDVEALLTTAIHQHQHSGYHSLAARALVRARLQHWDEALVDAQMAIDAQPSMIAYIAKSLAHVGKSEKDKAYLACDITFEHSHSSRIPLLLPIKAIVMFMAGEHHVAISYMDSPTAAVRYNSTCHTIQAYMYLLLGNTHIESSDYESAIDLLERARAHVQPGQDRLPLVVSLMSGWKFDDFHITVRQRLCEALYVSGRRKDAAESLLEMVNGFDEVYTSELITKWVSNFTHQCLSAPESGGDAVSTPTEDANMVTVHGTPTPLLREWAQAKLAHHSWKDALLSAVDFIVSRFTLYRAIYERLETIGCTIDASKCFRQMVDELVEDVPDESKWVFDSRRRCMEKLASSGDTAVSGERHGGAVSHYPTSLALKPATLQNLLIKRSQAYMAKGLWVEALNDANKVIELDPLSPWGYERRHAALHKAGVYENAVGAFEAMLSRLLESSDPEIRALHWQYIDPRETRKTIRKAVQDVIHDSPRVLINTLSGRLCDKSQQAVSFESHAAFNKLVSSMTTCIDDVRIKHEITEYYRYGMFSHKWEDNEPLFEQVIRMVVHKLEESPTHDKLKMFCKIVQDAGLQWAWSDTCCINKADHFVLEEALVAMFRWYEGSALTVVFLFDVLSPSRRGALMRSIWNTRAWTFQEYHASKVVRFYTKDWKLYIHEPRRSQPQRVARDHLGDGGGNRCFGSSLDGTPTRLG
ncbi:hypothetical protein V8E55_010260 [Tylopilus felleus]